MTAGIEVRPGSSLETFINEVRSSIEQASTMSELLRRLSGVMGQALKDPELLPADEDGVVYRDPDYLFQVNAGIQKPGSHNIPHDHGECWAVYGVPHRSDGHDPV